MSLFTLPEAFMISSSSVLPLGKLLVGFQDRLLSLPRDPSLAQYILLTTVSKLVI